MLRSRFPKFKILENACPMGSVYARDRMLRVASGDIVVSLDDDSCPIAPDFFDKVCSVFADHSEAAVVVVPELRGENRYSAADKTGKSPGHYVSAYANCVAAMRREFYLRQPGFAAFFDHMYEEPDYALQCYAGGAAVWFEPSLVVQHRESSANRLPVRRHHFHARNELWSVWLRCPWPWLPLVSAYRVLRQFLYAWSEGVSWVVREPLWWALAARGYQRCRDLRRPVPWSVYYRWVRLARKPIYSVQELRKKFPWCSR
jgi:GT2 family glycosyltransferase